MCDIQSWIPQSSVEKYTQMNVIIKKKVEGETVYYQTQFNYLPSLLGLQPHLASLQQHEHGLNKKYNSQPSFIQTFVSNITFTWLWLSDW